MLEKRSVIDSINVKEDGQLEIRRADKVFEDGVEIAKTYHRHVVVPGAVLKDEDARVQLVAKAVHTPEVIATFLSAQADTTP